MRKLFRRLIIHSIDTFFFLSASLGFFKKNTPPDPSSIKKLLLCQGAHLGDVVVATSILSLIKKRMPHVQIGFLIGSWSKPLIEGHPLITHVHCVDHWMQNRSSLPLWKKLLHYRRQRKQVLQEIRSYDAAIDLHPFLHNSIFLLYQAKIPLRIGHTRVGFGQLLTHPQPWKNKPQKIVDYHLELLRCLHIFPDKTTPLHPNLPSLVPSFLPKDYTIFHLGGSEELKEWPLENWEQLLIDFLRKKRTIVFTGHGKRQQELISQLKHPEVIDLCNRINLQELMALIKNAQLLISVDSLPVHIASAYQIPTVILFTGRDPLEHWSPHNPHSISLVHKTPCAPCFKKNGCATMNCIRKIPVEQVIKSTEQLLTRSPNR